MNSINTNISSLKAQQNMMNLNNDLDQAMTRLSSGLRINSAADDAAGSAISSKMESQVRSLGVAIRNSYDAISMTQTAEGALSEVENMLQRVRELAVQAGNSTLSNSDRTMIQSEVTALTQEIDKVAKNTSFNGVKLLDGSSATVNFQIGINANDALEVNLQKSDTLSLGLSGSVGVQTLSSERVTEKNFSLGSNIIAAADIKINGHNAFTTDFSSDLTATATNEAKTLADAVNANSGVHGANANAFNNVQSVQKGTFNMSATFTINTDTVELATSYEGIVTNINQSVSGVNATLNSDNTISLSNTTGEAIVIAGASSSDVGFTAGTFSGMVSLTNINGSAVKIEAGSEKNGYTNGQGTIADVAALGFNELSDGSTIETDTVSGASLSANEMRINDVLIGGSSNGQASSIAAAINVTSSDHGVTAVAKNEVTLALNLSAIPSLNAEFFINDGNVNLSSTSDINGIALAINNAAIGDVRATADTNGNLVLSSASGSDIAVDHGGDTDFIRAYKDVHGSVSQTGIKGGSATDVDSLFADATVSTTGALTILSPANFNGQVTVGATTHADRITASGLTAAAASTAGAQTLTASGTAVFAEGVQAQFVFASATAAAQKFTITGLDLNGNAQTEVVDGLAHTNTAYSAKSYSQITAISSNIASVGSSTTQIGIIKGEADNNFTIVGKDVFGQDITEVMSGAAGLLVAKSKNVFESVTSISVSKAMATNEKIVIGNHSDALTTATDTALVAAVHSPVLATRGTAATDLVAALGIATTVGHVVKSNSDLNAKLIIKSTATTTGTLLLTGTDVNGATITETIGAFSAANSVMTEQVFQTLTSAVHSQTDADAVVNIGSASVTLADATQDLGGAFVTITETASTAANGQDTSFTVTGVDLSGAKRQETITGPVADGTVTGSIAFATISHISQNTFGTTDSLTFGTIKSGDSFTTRGALELSSETGAAVKLEAVGADSQLLMEVEDDGGFATTETVLQKLGVQNQSQSFEVAGTNLAVDSLTNATASLALIDSAINKISSFRSSFGAVENRIDASISNLTTLKVNTEAAQSRITDADFAKETSNLTKSQILSQAATSMLAQANASKQNLLALLQG